MATRRLKSKALLAAPIVATAVFAPACEPRVYRNPGPPQEPTEVTPTNPGPPRETPETVPTSQPDTSPEDPPSLKAGDAPRLEKRPDGTCAVMFPPPDMSCPPGASCNPGPPRQPVPVKCPTTPNGSTSPAAGLPDAPKDGGGFFDKLADGTCLYTFPRSEPARCPPGARCNPGPPRQPILVKCPDGGSR